jgi:hypothetical protein
VDEQDRREAVRLAYKYRCGYCSVQEEETGGKLEIDHFHPRSRGGGDDLGNLVYCCPICNRLKGDFWPEGNHLTSTHRLLHPTRDNLTDHLREEEDGRLVALTEIGQFHITRLHLNRLPLVALRRARRERAQLRHNLSIAQEEQKRLRQKIIELERELNETLRLLNRLLGEES